MIFIILILLALSTPLLAKGKHCPHNTIHRPCEDRVVVMSNGTCGLLPPLCRHPSLAGCATGSCDGGVCNYKLAQGCDVCSIHSCMPDCTGKVCGNNGCAGTLLGMFF